MLSVEEARGRILAPLRPTPGEQIPLAEGWGRVLARPVIARVTQPPADVSAMDGYALRAGDQGGRRVIGAAPAGHPFAGRVGAGEAVRIFTGSPLPEGADAILLQEDAVREGERVIPLQPPVPARHIRRRGQDFAAGDLLLDAGTRLDPRGVGLCAAANHPWLAVHRRPRIAVLATGDEIALPGEPIPPGGIVSSNAHALAALVRAAGAEAVILPIAPDTEAAVAEAALAAQGADMLVTTGGASVGEHDLIQAGLTREGFELGFWKIAMRPGKPLISGRLGGMAVLGLPGNPVSALVCAILFLLPALERLQGRPGAGPATTMARLGAPLAANDHRADHLRAALAPGPDLPVATAFERQDSSMLRALAMADCLIQRPPHAPALPAGATVPVIRLDLLGL